ncbi:SDR family NAD(P)-dependent oxidoreductase [Streptomyces sp. ASQP_92]|uniref:SDR family NAD(P)-dependent oxidoreductase n=1 Tax=Streptomyces sp. ASQP_92 TaxID=2979116 RepID=UPI0021C246C8|nr:SDR family NAD(P)-dependent oxidoreductase [Streptomyces sp. ASQP_92]MCT9089789.1 SDR family NAD(P)-dependent oxidoreductase [Streptomyces sp. ASQP_92]
MTNEAVAVLNEAGCATEDTDTPVWLITGCSSGLGRALAEHALGRGDRVAVTARDAASVTGIATTTYGDRALALRLDVTDAESVVAATNPATHSAPRPRSPPPWTARTRRCGSCSARTRSPAPALAWTGCDTRSMPANR